MALDCEVRLSFRQLVGSFQLAKVVVFMAFWAMTASSCLAQQTSQRSSQEGITLKTFLQSYLRDPDDGDDKTTQYSYAFTDLDDDGVSEAIVYLIGQSWCGSGGCAVLVLKRNGSSYKVVTHMTIARPPIHVLPSKTKGWHDISVWVQGGGIQPGYAAVLSFNGKKYPGNPTTVSKRLSSDAIKGDVVIPLKPDVNYLYQQDVNR